MGKQINLIPPLEAANQEPLDEIAAQLNLTDDQEAILRVVVRKQRENLLALAGETKDDQTLGKARYNQARHFLGMREGMSYLVALLLNDETILDNPDDNL